MDSQRPKILIFIEHYLPGYKFGGPIRSVANLVTLLKSRYDIYLVTRDRDQGDRRPYPAIIFNKWLDYDGYHIIYLSRYNRTINKVEQLIREQDYDFIYTNSLFSPFTRILLLLSAVNHRRLTIAPRGELHAGAIHLKSYKKRPYVALVRMLPEDLIVWHATDQQEVDAIHRSFDHPRVACVPIRFAPDMPNSLIQRSQWHKNPGQLKLLSLARIARNKGLKFLLECLSKLTGGSVVLDIYGPIIDTRYWEECKQLIQAMPPACQVIYRGELNHVLVGSTMQQYDFLAMPTDGENFGHVIFEALSSGLPVLISDQTPWQQLASTQAGWELPLNQDRWNLILKDCLAMDHNTYSQLVDGAITTAKSYIKNEPFEESYLHLFSQ